MKTMANKFAMVCAVFFCAGAFAQEAEVFDFGAALDAGVLSGEWSAEGGELIGRTEPGGMAWWRLPGEYWDFELEVEFRTLRPANGGVQYRSHWMPKVPVEAEPEFVMYGYQANVETRVKGRTGVIVDENGRGDLVLAALDTHELVKQRQWNTMRVRAVGATQVVWINGAISAVLHDEAGIGGLIGFQVFPNEDGAAEVRYRNLKLTDLGRDGDWRSLFDGKTLDGWKNWGSESWTVVGGTIQGRRGPKKSEGYLATEETWQDFRVRGQFKMLGDGNYGLFYHSRIRLREDGYPLISGVQGEVAPGFPGPSGWHYESYRRGWIVEPDTESPAAYAVREGEWNEIEIRREGNRISSWVNGYRVMELHDTAPQVFEGSFALQLHAGEGEGIDWRGLYVAGGVGAGVREFNGSGIALC